MDPLAHRIQREMQRAFFDKISSDIKDNNFDSTFTIIDEIKARICLVVPKRIDIHEQIHETLDIDYFKQMVTHNAFELTMIKSVMTFIIDKIKELGAENDEPWHEIWRTQTEVRFQREESLDIILPNFLKEALFRIDKLERDIAAFKNSEMYKMLMEQRERNEFLSKNK